MYVQNNFLYVIDSAIISTKVKRARSANKGKISVDLYNRICTAVSLFGDLMEIERLTDTIVLQVKFFILYNQ